MRKTTKNMQCLANWNWATEALCTQWGRSARKEVLLKELRATPETRITVLGQEDRVERFTSRYDIGTRFEQKEEGLEVSVVRAQRLYNNRRWPNAVVLRLANVEFNR